MTKALRYVISSVVAAGFAVGMGFLLRETREQRAQYACKEMVVSFEDSLRFVSESEIRTYVSEEYGKFVGQRLDSVGLARIESILESRSAIMNAQAWTTDDGVLHVSVTQRAPALRFQDEEKGFYVDDRGFIFPLHASYTAPVRVINGRIPVSIPEGFKGEAPRETEKEWIQGMLALDSFIAKSRVWKNSVPDIAVESNGDITIKTTKGSESIVIGSYTNLTDKFRRLERYYDTILPQKGEGHYNKVNLKYNKQIVCRKDM